MEHSRRKPLFYFLTAIWFLFVMAPTFGYGGYADECTPQNTLTPDMEKANFGKDKEIKNTLCLGPGTYNYRHVNIYGDGKTEGKLIFLDAKIDFWAMAILVENGGSLTAGSPESPIGTKDVKNIVTIHLYGDEKAPGITCKTTNIDDHLSCGVSNDQWLHGDDRKWTLPGGVPDDYFYRYVNLPTYDDQNDGEYYFGLKTMAVSYGGSLQMFGKKGATYYDSVDASKAAVIKGPVNKGDRHLTLNKFVDWKPGDKIVLFARDVPWGASETHVIKAVIADSQDYHSEVSIEDAGVLNAGKDGKVYMAVEMDPSGTSWTRLNGNLKQDDNTLVLDRAVDWQPGDRIVVTTTDYLPGHSETLTIQSIDDKKTKITFQEKIKYPHNGEKYSLEKHGIPDRLKKGGFSFTDIETRAAVALLSRNIRIVSEKCSAYDPQACKGLPEEAGSYFGGHTIVRQGFRQYQMQGVEFYQLGQGGRMAHSPVNFHLVRQAPADTFIRDCSVWDSMTHWYELRGAQNVTLERNVGYNSIGHGYYLADGTEVNNVLSANIGIHARAAVNSGQNPRMAPGVLAMTSKDAHVAGDNIHATYGVEYQTYQSDYIHPAVFHIMNAYNHFEHNMAAGAGTCGACYWIVPTKISGLSRQRKMKWSGYANIQTDTPGAAPIKSFKGNFCSTAQHSLMTIGGPGVCSGVSDNPDQSKWLAPIQNPFTKGYVNLDLYPMTSNAAVLQPNLCKDDDCASATCNKGITGQCAVSVIDSYTSSFHWAQTNFAAIWLRTNWFLMTDSALTDVLHGGLTMVSGGSYDQVINGYWALTRNSVFVGNTQPWDTTKTPPAGNPYTTNAGPFHKFGGLQCDAGTPASCCASKDEGISIPIDNFAVYQRLYSIYDGPVFQENNAFLQIKKTPVDKCGYPGGGCDSSYMYGSGGRGQGIIKAQEDSPEIKKGQCILPNAAIGWKQPNGFYYPPAFNSGNLYFNDVDIRHYIIVPLFKPGTTEVYEPWIDRDYCYFPGIRKTLFSNDFTDVDRQTELNDDDGTLSGLTGANPPYPLFAGTVSVNKDKFYIAPTMTMECSSEQTCFQAPYDYVTAVVYPNKAGKKPAGLDDTIPECNVCDPRSKDPCPWDNNWCNDCQQRNCYGVPIYRQYYTDREDQAGEKKNEGQNIRMMGTGIWQRSTMITNQGKYYIDTGVSKTAQIDATPIWVTTITHNLNVFEPNKTYNVFLLYAKPSTSVAFQLYVGKGLDRVKFESSNVRMVRAGTVKNAPGEDNVVVLVNPPLAFTPVTGQDGKAFWPDNYWEKTYNPDTGILEVAMDMGFKKDDANPMIGRLASDFDKNARKEACKPSSFCRWDDKEGKCCASSDGNKCDDTICRWSVKALECPSGGCLGFQVDFPDGFRADDDKGGKYRPDTEPFPGNWKVKWSLADPSVSGDSAIPGQCVYSDQNPPPQIPDNLWKMEVK